MTLGHATNNVAEYRGLLLGLERAAALGADEVEVVNDSELIAKQIDGSYKVKQRRSRARCTQQAQGRAGALRALVDPLGAARARTRPPTRSSTARSTARRSRRGPLPETVTAGGTDYATYLLIDDLLRAAAAAHARRPRRAAVHRRPPGLRALVQADPARAGRRARRARGRPPARRGAAAAPRRRRRAAAARRSSRCSRR